MALQHYAPGHGTYFCERYTDPTLPGFEIWPPLDPLDDPDQTFWVLKPDTDFDEPLARCTTLDEAHETMRRLANAGDR